MMLLTGHISFKRSLEFLSPLEERLGEGVMQDETTRARELRRDGSRAERICWEILRDRRMNGPKFRRQHAIGPYFADFACVSRTLVIEIDGDHHAFQVDADARRTAAMECEGVACFALLGELRCPESGRYMGGDRAGRLASPHPRAKATSPDSPPRGRGD
jgi:very-short-patch-repair endonuclease